MKIAGRRTYLVSMESVAMTDIVLNMFIFFFISFSLLYTFSPYKIQKLEVKLPEARHLTPINEKSQVNIIVSNEGVVYLDKAVVTKKELKDRVANLYRNNPGLAVVLRSDRLVKFKDIVGVLDILTELGIKNLNIAAITEQ